MSANPSHLQTVYTLRCTHKLLARLHAVPVAQPPSPDTVLGDWTATLVRAGRVTCVLALSERTLLPLVVPAAPGATLLRRLADGIQPALQLIGIAPADAAAEAAAMQSACIAKTANRRVIGSLNDLGLALQVALTQSPERPVHEHALRLARTPMSYIERNSPDRATVAAFEARRVVGRMMGR